MTTKTAPEMFDELANSGYITPATGPMDLTMPSAYRSVQSGLVYSTPEAPITTGVHIDAKLDGNTGRDKKSNKKRPKKRSR